MKMMQPMNSKITFILLLLFLLMNRYHSYEIIMMQGVPREEYILQKFHVRIANQLPRNSKMGVHCKSGDDDLGMHMIGNQQEYGFSFRLNLFKTTRFWCHVLWESDGVGVVGDVFWPNDDFLSRCRHDNCVWVVKQDGVQFRDPLTNDIFVYYNWE